MNRLGGERSQQPVQKKILRVENTMFDGDWNEDGHARRTPENEHDPRTVFEYGSNTDYYMEYDYDIENLLQQLPSRQLESVAETASRALWKRKVGQHLRGSMKIHKDNELEDEILGYIDRNVGDFDEFYGDLYSTVRTMPTTLTRKKHIKNKLSSQIKGLSRWTLTKYWFSRQWLKTKRWLVKKDMLFDLWKSHLLVIEGCFGSSVVSYFIFLKWILLINIPIFLLTFSFLVIPQILYFYYQMVDIKRPKFTGIEILTGTGFFNNSEMYYGFYTIKTVEVAKGSRYEMKYAYLLTCGAYYLFCLIILGYSFLRSYRKYYIKLPGSYNQYLFDLMFCSWDFGLRSQETVQLKHRHIYNEFKEYLAGYQTSKREPTGNEMMIKWAIRAFAWTVVLALICASGYITYIVSTELSIKANLANSTTYVENVANSLAMPIVISLVQMVFPMIFSFFEAYEQFSKPKFELYVHMFREQLLRATILGVLVYFWLELSATKVQDWLSYYKGNETVAQVKCWENFVGQELYRLTVMDLIFSIFYAFFMEFIRKLCSLRWSSIQRPQFAIAKYTLDLIYTQCLCWLGIFYAPLLPVVVIIKLIITFYVKRYSCLHNCRPSLKPWRASSTHTIFIGYMFLFFIFSCIAAFFGIFSIKPSEVCGPYKNYNRSYEVIENVVHQWEKNNAALGKILTVIDSPGFFTAVLILLCMAVYYTRAVMVSRRKRVEQFKLQLGLEGKDKQFLLKLLNQVRMGGSKSYDKPRPSIILAMEAEASRAYPGKKVFIRTVAERLHNEKVSMKSEGSNSARNKFHLVKFIKKLIRSHCTNTKPFKHEGLFAEHSITSDLQDNLVQNENKQKSKSSKVSDFKRFLNVNKHFHNYVQGSFKVTRFRNFQWLKKNSQNVDQVTTKSVFTRFKSHLRPNVQNEDQVASESIFTRFKSHCDQLKNSQNQDEIPRESIVTRLKSHLWLNQNEDLIATESIISRLKPHLKINQNSQNEKDDPSASKFTTIKTYLIKKM